MAHRREKKILNTAIVRLEQLYPFPQKAFDTELRKWPKATEIVWCRENRAIRACGTGLRHVSIW